ncbi:MAG: beta-ketoacyl-ACP synthase II, partial [Chloroflexota bacterium]|nr:beta-ketoacyl-ACP synthase II [Chloroflexota bacterium]
MKGQNGFHRVVVTGMGAVTPLGLDAESYWQGLIAGRSGVSCIREFDASDHPVKIAGYIRGFEPTEYMDHKEVRRLPRFAHLAIAATQQAIEDAGLELSQEDPMRVGIEMGNAIGNIETTVEQHDILQTQGARRLVPSVIPGVLINMASCAVAMHFGMPGPGSTPVAACATGIYAVGDAYRRLQRGETDVVVAGATDSSRHPLAVGSFWRIGALSTRNDDPEGACRPFDKERDGTVMAEGAAVLIMESEEHARARGARVLAEVIGYGLSQDAYHMIAPDPEGAGAARAMQAALDDAGILPEQVDWISAHGTATPLNDLSETLAIKQVFGEHAFD